MQRHVGCDVPAAGGCAWLLVYFVGCMHTPSAVRRQCGRAWVDFDCLHLGSFSRHVDMGADMRIVLRFCVLGYVWKIVRVCVVFLRFPGASPYSAPLDVQDCHIAVPRRLCRL